MNPRAAELIDRLDLKPHPEGGFFREIFRSAARVSVPHEESPRNAMTEIYFLLPGGDCSRLHRVGLDEVWHYYEGAALELFWLGRGEKQYHRRMLGEVGENSRPVEVIPADCWQAARSTGAYTLVGCTVAPGFEFSDFRLLNEDAQLAGRIKRQFPVLAALV